MPPRRRNSAHPSIVPFQNFATADGWIVVGAAKQDFWERLCEVIGRPELNDDPRFATRARATSIATSWCRCSTRRSPAPTSTSGSPRSWRPVCPLRGSTTWMGALAEPQTIARGTIVEHDHPTLGRVRSIRTPLRLSGPSSLEREARAGPRRGEHTDGGAAGALRLHAGRVSTSLP